MKAPQKILVPIDLSAYSLVGVQYAQEIATLFNAEVVLVHIDEHKVVAPVGSTGRGRAEASEQARREEIVKTIQRLLMDRDLVSRSLRIEVRHKASPAIGIVRATEELNADLVVMSTHGRSGLSRVLMGSVAEKVVRYSKVPVLTVKPEEIRELVEITEEDIAEELHTTL